MMLSSRLFVLALWLLNASSSFCEPVYLTVQIFRIFSVVGVVCLDEIEIVLQEAPTWSSKQKALEPGVCEWEEPHSEEEEEEEEEVREERREERKEEKEEESSADREKARGKKKKRDSVFRK